MVNWSTLIDNKICSCTSSSVWTILPTRIRKIHQVILGFNTGLSQQASFKTEYHLVAFSDSSWQDFTDTGRSTGANMILYQGGKIDHGTHVPGPVAQ